MPVCKMLGSNKNALANRWFLLMVTFCLGSNQLISTVFSASEPIKPKKSVCEILERILLKRTSPTIGPISPFEEIPKARHQLDSNSRNSMDRDRLHVGEKIFVNEVLVSDNERFEARLLEDGKVVVRNRDDGAIRLTVGTSNVRTDAKIESLQMTEEGQLVLSLYDSIDTRHEISLVTYPKEDCTGGGDCVLIMQGDGNLVAYKNYLNSKPIPFFSAWHSQRYRSWSSSEDVKPSTTRFAPVSTTSAPISPTTTITNDQANSKRGRLFVGDKLFVNESLVSDNDKFEARLLKDGKVVVSDREDGYVRLTVDSGMNLNADDTEAEPEILFLQMLPDGQLVLSILDGGGIQSQVPLATYSKQDCSGSHCVLLMQDDGNLVAYNKYNSSDPYPYPFFSAWHTQNWSSELLQQTTARSTPKPTSEAPPSTTKTDNQHKRDRLFVGDKLGVNEVLVSNNHLYEARLLEDGKVIISPRGGGYIRFVIGSDGLKRGSGEKIEYLEMLRDGQIVVSVSNDVHGRNGSKTWRQVPLMGDYPRENCNDSDVCVLIIEDDGHLVAYRKNPPKSSKDAFFSAIDSRWWTLELPNKSASKPTTKAHSSTFTPSLSITTSQWDSESDEDVLDY